MKYEMELKKKKYLVKFLNCIKLLLFVVLVLIFYYIAFTFIFESNNPIFL